MGRIAEAIAGSEKQFEAKSDSEGKIKFMEKITGWRSALTKVANLIGLNLRDHVDGLLPAFTLELHELLGLFPPFTLKLYSSTNLLQVRPRHPND
ncbi:hypothetical protein LguiB_021750 [Lonicera macranthoides]